MFKDCARIFQCIECLRCGSLAHWVASLESQFSCLRRLIIHSVIPLLLYVPVCICVSLLFDCCCILTAWEEKVPDMHFAGVCFHSYLLFVFELWQMFQFAGSYFIWVCLFLELKPSGTIWLGSVLDKLPLSQNLFPICFCQMSNDGGVWNNTKMLKHGRVLEIGSIKVARLPKKKICSSITWATLARQPLPSSTWPTIRYLPFSF